MEVEIPESIYSEFLAKLERDELIQVWYYASQKNENMALFLRKDEEQKTEEKMIYDIYEQAEQTQDVIGHRLVTRYHTIHKRRAFMFMNEKNKIAGKNVWRVAIQIRDRIIFDIDCHGFTKHDMLDIVNLKRIYNYYSKLFSIDFKIIKTHSGYHLISKFAYKPESVELQYDLCRVLNPLLEPKDLQKYIEAVQKYYLEYKDVPDFLDGFPEKFRASGLFCGIGNFDLLFAINVILKGYYCLRISKKSKDDNPKAITI